MMNQKLSLSIIGCGRMGITHYSILNFHPGVVIRSVADPFDLMTKLMTKYLHIQTFKDYHELFEVGKPDAVVVSTPPNLHYPIVKKAAEKGVHVFVEKPFTTRYRDAFELHNLFRDAKLVNQVGYVNRFNDIFRKTKEFLDNGLLGNIIRFRSEMYSCTVTENAKSKGWRSLRESGGGALYEMASHAIDLVNFLIGKPAKITGSSLSKVYSSEIEDIVSSTLLYENGISGSIYINWSDKSYRKPTNRIEIFGDKGKLIADQYSMKIYLNNADKNLNLKQGWNTIYITDIFKPVPSYVRGNEFTSQLYNFIDVINGKSPAPACSFKDAADTLEVIEEILNDFNTNGKLL